MNLRSTTVLLLILGLILPGIAMMNVAAPAREGVTPMVDKPTGDGPYNVGTITDTVSTTTKAYDVNVKIYYPAETDGVDTVANSTNGPYPTIIWLPGFGGNENHYDTWLDRWATWGMVVMAVGVTGVRARTLPRTSRGWRGAWLG